MRLRWLVRSTGVYESEVWRHEGNTHYCEMIPKTEKVLQMYVTGGFQGSSYWLDIPVVVE